VVLIAALVAIGGGGTVAVVIAGAAVVIAAVMWVVERGRYRAWGYAERDDDLIITRGLLIKKLSVVPYGRMQFIDVTAGPLDRLLGLATVQLHTAAAATDARIPGLRVDDATALRDRLTTLGEARATGI
jgi:membrane protein YdbS with pleckstrin-like domain